LSVFAEGAVSLGGSEYNLQRLALFAEVDDEWRRRPIISSSVLRGRLEVVRAFYRTLLAEFVGRRDLLRIPKVIQGAVNRVCHDGKFEHPVIVHPNAGEVYFEIGPQSLTHDIRLGVRVGGAVPAVVVAPFHETPLMSMLRASLHL
jgi:hypothetical protein